MSSDSGSESGSDLSTSDRPYTSDELATIILDFYKFLTTLHFDVADLKIPPPGGWPNLTKEVCADFVCDDALDVMRRLPYFGANNHASVHYKSQPLDYSTYTRANFEGDRWRWEGLEFWSDREGEIVDPSYVICLSEGHESCGRSLYLDTKNGEITEDWVRCDQLSAVDIKDFFSDLEEAYRTLKLIPCPRRTTIDAPDIPETTDTVSEEQVIAQEEEWWGTPLDIQYLRQLYRQYGWPNAFRREEAFRALDQFMASIVKKRGDWGKDDD